VLARALLLLCVTVVGLLPAWSMPELQGTEGRRLQIALEMVQSGDWMIPTIGGQPTWAKPPLHYWLLATCAELFGSGTWSVRLPSVLMAFLAAFCAMELLRPWFGGRVGLVAGLGIALSPFVLFMWPTAEIDPIFASLTAVSLWFLATGVARERPLLVLASGLIGGLALLQKGPPYFLFAVGAYLVWFRRRSGRFALLHFVPLIAVALAYYVPLWLVKVSPNDMLAVAGDESVGRLAYYEWKHFVDIPAFWVRAVAVQLPFILWCFWEWHGPRDARMDAGDLTLRMCSGGALIAVVLLTFFPGRPTRYLLPNVLLFTFAVAPAVTHFHGQKGTLGTNVRRAVTVVGVVGALALLALPFVPEAGFAGIGVALAAAISPFVVRAPRHVLPLCLALPLIAAWTVGLERSITWRQSERAQGSASDVLRAELERLGATAELATFGHVEGPLLLGAGLLPKGDESARSRPAAKWLLTEDRSVATPEGYVERVHVCTPRKTFVVSERAVTQR
jgi:4-amino-4-deoxy-L-arabinose transferase-like glycosyltransferase